MATEAQMKTATETIQTIAGAVIDIVEKSAALGFPAPLGITGVIGALAALGKSHGMDRANVHKALDSAWDDIEAGE
jgi:hypothetical protein